MFLQFENRFTNFLVTGLKKNLDFNSVAGEVTKAVVARLMADRLLISRLARLSWFTIKSVDWRSMPRQRRHVSLTDGKSQRLRLPAGVIGCFIPPDCCFCIISIIVLFLILTSTSSDLVKPPLQPTPATLHCCVDLTLNGS